MSGLLSALRARGPGGPGGEGAGCPILRPSAAVLLVGPNVPNWGVHLPCPPGWFALAAPTRPVRQGVTVGGGGGELGLYWPIYP